MNASQRTPDRIEEFIQSFFGAGNIVWPDRDPDSSAGRRLVPYLQVLRDRSEVPVVLPRRRAEDDHQLTAYVIALNAAHATAVAELLTAFVGPSFSTFDGLPARLDPSDPVDQAVLDFAGPGLVFALSSPTRCFAGASLERTGATAGHHEAAPRAFLARAQADRTSIGRIRGRAGRGRQFGVRGTARATGGQRRTERHQPGPPAGQAPRTTRARRGVAPHGRPRRNVVVANPPIPVKDAVLAAIYSHTVAEPLSQGDLAAAREKLIDVGALVPSLISSNWRCTSATTSARTPTP